MLEICCRLTCLLNDLCAGRTTAPHAEAELLRMAAAHHVHDPDETLGLSEHDPLSSVPIRMALARISHVPHDTPVLWGLLLPAPGSACWSARSGSGQPSRSRRRCSRRLSSRLYDHARRDRVDPSSGGFGDAVDGRPGCRSSTTPYPRRRRSVAEIGHLRDGCSAQRAEHDVRTSSRRRAPAPHRSSSSRSASPGLGMDRDDGLRCRA